jgi:RNA polymerase sigma-70 factor (ECF subfamily)
VGVSTAYAQAPPRDTTALLYERHSSRIFGFCLSRLGSREDAEDALQLTFLNAQRGLGRGVVPEYELAWLFKIAQNVCHNRHQSAKRRGRVEAPHDLDSLQDVIASPERGGTGVSLGELTQALGTIPARQRKALLLREFQGYSYEEIAAELDVSVAAVETLLFRARRAVAQQLEQTGATQSRGRSAVAGVLEVFQWLFKGGAAPLKLAAVAATVATTASLAVVPAVRDEEYPDSAHRSDEQVAHVSVIEPAQRTRDPLRVVEAAAGVTDEYEPVPNVDDGHQQDNDPAYHRPQGPVVHDLGAGRSGCIALRAVGRSVLRKAHKHNLNEPY